jgi:hypothetical protein
MSVINFNSNGVTVSYTEDEKLDLQSNGVSMISVSNDYMTAPSGNTSQRPASPEGGMMRYNNETNKMEIYNGLSWANVA